MRIGFVTVDEYIEAAEPERRTTLRALRELVRETVPEVREEVRYGMPYYDHHGELCAFAAQKRYFSFYVIGAGSPLTAHRAELGKLDVGKGCIRFRRLEEVPPDTLRAILREAARANEAAA